MSAQTDPIRTIGRPNAAVQKPSHLVPWIWDGIVTQEAVTLLSAPEKKGKTTLLSLLLDRRRTGGELLGRTVWPGKTVVCSEEHERLWALRQPPLDFGPDLTFLQPPGPFPLRGRWNRFVDDVYELSLRDESLDLVVIDTAKSFLPLGGRNKRTQQWALSTLSQIANFPAGVLILNQSRNMHRLLAAFADIVVEMEIPRGAEETSRRRCFTAVGRYPGTLSAVTAELNEAGTDYVLLDGQPPQRRPLLATLQTLLGASSTLLTQRELLERWPDAPPRPDSLWRALAGGLERGLFTAEGAGTKTEPYRFGLRKAAEEKNEGGEGDTGS